VVRATVEEKNGQGLQPGLEGRAIAVLDPLHKVAVKLERVSAVPVSPGSFEATFTLTASEIPAALMPGMACTIKVVPYQKADALTLPSTAVFTDEAEDDSRFVYLLGKDGHGQKHAVKAGREVSGKT
jgi:hypothetical protein